MHSFENKRSKKDYLVPLEDKINWANRIVEELTPENIKTGQKSSNKGKFRMTLRNRKFYRKTHRRKPVYKYMVKNVDMPSLGTSNLTKKFFIVDSKYCQ